jgi:hypothetical protein
MRILRGGRTETYSDETDSISPGDLAAEWHPGTPIWFDATRDKSGARHSDVGIEITSDDVAALCLALLGIDDPVAHRGQRTIIADARRRIRAERDERRRRAKLALKAAARLGGALSDIHNLVALRDSDDNPGVVLDQVYEVVRATLFDEEGNPRQL